MARHNLSTVVSFEFRRTVTKRRFWAITLILPILVFGLGSLIIASNVSTAQTADKQKNERFEFLYSDASGLIDPAIAKEYAGTEIRSDAEGVEEVQVGREAALGPHTASLAGPLERRIHVGHADLQQLRDDAAGGSDLVAPHVGHDDRAVLPDPHLGTVGLADLHLLLETKGPLEPGDGASHVGVDEHRRDGRGRRGAVRLHGPEA